MKRDFCLILTGRECDEAPFGELRICISLSLEDSSTSEDRSITSGRGPSGLLALLLKTRREPDGCDAPAVLLLLGRESSDGAPRLEGTSELEPEGCREVERVVRRFKSAMLGPRDTGNDAKGVAMDEASLQY